MENIHRTRYERFNIITEKDCRIYTEILHIVTIMGGLWTAFSLSVGLDLSHYVVILLSVLFIGHGLVTWLFSDGSRIKNALHEGVDMLTISVIPFGFLLPLALKLFHIYDKRYFPDKKDAKACFVE